jgi:hypothetical protein
MKHEKKSQHMIFAELQYKGRYQEIHKELLAFVGTKFVHIQSGLQGDSWIWILDGGEKVAIDTFSSMKHQIKSRKSGEHVEKVIDVLRERYKMTVYEKPKGEAHEKN